jgi:predicted GNAT superfamily acetyltransferase
VIDMYGSDTDSALHRGLGTDRFIVAWEIAAPRMHDPPPPPEAQSTARVVNASAGDGVPTLPQLRDGPPARPLRVEIPLEIDKVQQRSLELAGRWRATTRAAFTWALEHGYHVAGFYRDAAAGRGYYVLARKR